MRFVNVITLYCFTDSTVFIWQIVLLRILFCMKSKKEYDCKLFITINSRILSVVCNILYWPSISLNTKRSKIQNNGILNKLATLS